MIALVEGAERQKTPNEIALNILLAGMTIIFLFAVATIPSFAAYAGGTMPRAGAGRAVRDPDPDHDRRAAVGHRHRRHGPAGALQRAGDVRPRGRGGGRRRHAAARQDRHHHARQPPGHGVPAGARRDRARTGRRGAARLACRRDAGGPLDRRAGQGEIRHPRPRHGAAACAVHPLLGADAHERRRRRRRPIRKGAVDAVIAVRARPARGAAVPPRGRAASPTRSPSPAARRWPWPRTAGCSASSTSRTSSRAASTSASPSCAAWASAP